MSFKSKFYIALIVLGVLMLVFDKFSGPDIPVSVNETPEDTGEEMIDSEPKEESGVEVASSTDKSDLIIVTAPSAGATVTNPISVAGQARGPWYFEASFPLIVTDWDGRIIGEGFATADGEWMTEDFVPFTGTVSFDLPADTPYQRGTLIFRKDNPSGLPEHDDALEIPVLFE